MLLLEIIIQIKLKESLYLFSIEKFLNNKWILKKDQQKWNKILEQNNYLLI